MLLFTTNDLRSTEIIHITGAEGRLHISRTEWGKALQVMIKTTGDIPKVDNSIYGKGCLRLGWLDMLLYIFIETLAELRHVFPTYCQATGVCMTAKVNKKITTALNGRIHIKAGNRTCTTGSKLSVTGKDYRWTEIDFCQS